MFVFIVILISIVILSGGGFYYISKDNSNKAKDTPASASPQTNKANTTTVKNKAAPVAVQTQAAKAEAATIHQTHTLKRSYPNTNREEPKKKQK